MADVFESVETADDEDPQTPEAREASQAMRKRVGQALKRYDVGLDAQSKQLKREVDDLKMQVPELQWPDEVRIAREAVPANTMPGQTTAIPARPMLSVATLDEPVQLVLNQQRKADLGVLVHAVNEDATDETADMLGGLYRHIEMDSNAHMARAWCFDRGAKCGRGYYRILKVYDPYGGQELDQKLVFRRVLYQSAVVDDPFAQEPDKSDREWLIFPTPMRWSTYKRKYGTSNIAQFTDAEFNALAEQYPSWATTGSVDEESRTVVVAESWRVEVTTRMKHLLTTGQMAFEEDIDKDKTLTVLEGAGARSVEVETRRVFFATINCREELTPEQEWDGQYIPWIFYPGVELQPFDNERRWKGMYTNAKDGARLTNYAASNAVEMAALEPKAPWQGEEGIFEGHEREYAESNRRNIPYLQYKKRGLDGSIADAPKRVQADMSRLGPSMELLRLGTDFVQRATSTFDPALGKQPTAHRSGRAIIALQDQTVEGTSHYLDNMKDIAMLHESVVVLDLIPHVYDRPGRIARILDKNLKPMSVMLNQPYTVDPRTKRPTAYQAQPGEDVKALAADPRHPVKFYDLKKGQYAITTTIGRSNRSRLQQGSEEMSAILSAAPELMPIIGPEYFKFRDFPGHDMIADLLEKMRDHQMPWLSTQGPSSETQLATAMGKLKEQEQIIQQMQQVIETDKVKEAGKVQIEQLKFEHEIELQRMKDATQIRIKEIDAEIKGLVSGHAAAHEADALARDAGHAAAAQAADHAHARDTAAGAAGTDAQAADLEHQRALVQNEQAAAHATEGIATTAAAQPVEPAPPSQAGEE